MAHPRLLSTRVFTSADQTDFAILSGDWNPMHMDALAARRTQAGSPVVHGVHAVAWAVETYAAQLGPVVVPMLLSVRFDRFIYLDQEVEAWVVDADENGFLITLSLDGAKVASIKGENATGRPPSPSSVTGKPQRAPLKEARNLHLPELVGAEGQFDASTGSTALAASFPALVRKFGLGGVSSLVALSTLVGMHAPGLHSIFSKFSVVLDVAEPGTVSYRIIKVQPILRAIEIEVHGPGLSGAVSCFVRRPPVLQPSTAALSNLSLPDCTGHRVLVVGGSRGLGEVAAKLCALGGADVTITYSVGSLDAEAVKADIVANGGRCVARRLNVTELLEPQLEQTGGGFTHVYYFATSQIFRQKGELLSREQLSQFLDIHLIGFEAICRAVASSGEPVRAFYPSSVALDENPKAALEYVIAKKAGELLCGVLADHVPGLSVLVERLPRTDTDQTATVLPVKSATTTDVILPIVRRMHAGH